MIAIYLTNVKNCMAQLLLKDTFDHFLFIEGEIVTANTFTIDGFIQKKFYEGTGTAQEVAPQSSPSYPAEYSSWGSLRDYCFSIIKGKRTPLSFKFIFSFSPESIRELIQNANLDIQADDVQGLYLNIKYDGEQLICITGTSFKSFSLDKTLEHAWDQYVQEFFENNGIAVTVGN